MAVKAKWACTASTKTLNAKNLEALGADRLAALLIEIGMGSSVAKRRLRLELAVAAGGDNVREIHKRIFNADLTYVSHSTAPHFAGDGDPVTTRRHERRPDDERDRITAESFPPGAAISAVARRNGVL